MAEKPWSNGMLQGRAALAFTGDKLEHPAVEVLAALQAELPFGVVVCIFFQADLDRVPYRFTEGWRQFNFRAFNVAGAWIRRGSVEVEDDRVYVETPSGERLWINEEYGWCPDLVIVGPLGDVESFVYEYAREMSNRTTGG